MQALPVETTQSLRSLVLTVRRSVKPGVLKPSYFPHHVEGIIFLGTTMKSKRLNLESCNSPSHRTQDLLEGTKVKTYICSKKVSLFDVWNVRKMLFPTSHRTVWWICSCNSKHAPPSHAVVPHMNEPLGSSSTTSSFLRVPSANLIPWRCPSGCIDFTILSSGSFKPYFVILDHSTHGVKNSTSRFTPSDDTTPFSPCAMKFVIRTELPQHALQWSTPAEFLPSFHFSLVVE